MSFFINNSIIKAIKIKALQNTIYKSCIYGIACLAEVTETWISTALWTLQVQETTLA